MITVYKYIFVPIRFYSRMSLIQSYTLLHTLSPSIVCLPRSNTRKKGFLISFNTKRWRITAVTLLRMPSNTFYVLLPAQWPLPTKDNKSERRIVADKSTSPCQSRQKLYFPFRNMYANYSAQFTCTRRWWVHFNASNFVHLPFIFGSAVCSESLDARES